MSKAVWDEIGKHVYETGVDHGMLYPEVNNAYPVGCVWNGLTGVTESPSGAEATPLYADNIKYLNLVSVEEYGATINAYTYPDEWMQCDGSAEIMTGVTIGQQPRKEFGFVYRTRIGNDTQLDNYGYKLHLIYNALASPSDQEHSTVNDSPEATEFSWEISTTAIPVEGYKPTATLVIDSTKTTTAALKAIEDVLFGTDSTDPRLPLPGEVLTIMKNADAEETFVTVTITEPESTSVTEGDTLTLTGTASDNSVLTWSSSDEAVATVV